MVGKIASNMQTHGSQLRPAGQELHHINLGPGPVVEAEWLAAGLELPNLGAMREYRINRVRAQLIDMG